MHNNPWVGHYPYAAYSRAFRHRRGGSRLLWFIIGAGTSAFWIKSHQAHEWHARHCGRDRIPQDAYPPPSSLEETRREKDWRRSGWWGSRESWGPWQAQAQTEAAQTSAPAVPAQSSPHVLPPPMPTDRWDEERLRVQNLGKQATETVSLSFIPARH